MQNIKLEDVFRDVLATGLMVFSRLIRIRVIKFYYYWLLYFSL
jgi:hypothetical protein